jgi:DNA-binding LacI/PurR family transcriptional regulator
MQPTRHELRQIAVRAGVDPRTVARWLDGEFLKSLATASAIQISIGELGYERFASRAKQTGPRAKQTGPSAVKPKPRRPVR